MDLAERVEKIEAELAVVRQAVTVLSESLTEVAKALNIRPPAMATRELSILAPDGGRVCGVLRGRPYGVFCDFRDSQKRSVIQLETDDGIGKLTIFNHLEGTKKVYGG